MESGSNHTAVSREKKKAGRKKARRGISLSNTKDGNSVSPLKNETMLLTAFQRFL
jgi:hypothetical protein